MSELSKIGVASDLGIVIRSHGDISDALMASLQHGGLILSESELGPNFFDLRTGLAGEAFQKFVNYSARVAILVEQQDAYGERFSELVREHRTHPLVRFFSTSDEAREWLAQSESERVE